MNSKLLSLLLIVSFLNLKAQDYVVESIGFTPPHSYIQEASGVLLDDGYSGVIPLGFDFEFYGIIYNEVVIGGNGILNFNISVANGYCPWEFEQDLPSETMQIKNSIFGVYHDMNPTVSQDAEINFSQYGTTPNRRFVVNFYQVPLYYCYDI